MRNRALLVIGIALLSACGGSSESSAPPSGGSSVATGAASADPATAGTATALPAELAGRPAAEALETESLPATSFVGRVESSDAYIAVVERGDQLTAYVCDGEATALWFEGLRSESGFTASHPSGAELSAQKLADGYQGTVVVDGASLSFTTALAVFPAGLWEGFDGFDLSNPSDTSQLGRLGWIVLADGTQRGAKVTQTTTSPSGTVDPDTGTGGDVPASPIPPSPTPTGDPLSAEDCQSIKDAYFQVDIDTVEETNAGRKAVLRKLLVNLSSRYTKGGCKTTLGGPVWP